MKSEIERFLSKVNSHGNSTGCWEWLGCHLKTGYGIFVVKGTKGKWINEYAHRSARRILIGDLFSHQEIHHICHNKGCCNPNHLEPISRQKHAGERHFDKIDAIAEKRRTATHCWKGHEFTPENTGRNKFGRRWCKTCHLKRTAARQRRIAAEKRDRQRAKFP